MLTVDERTQEAAKINKALGIKAPKSTPAVATLDAARGPYIRLLGSLGSNGEVKAGSSAAAGSSVSNAGTLGLKRIGNVLEEDQTEGDMLVVGRLQVLAQLVGSEE
jgi:hypothetical protein